MARIQMRLVVAFCVQALLVLPALGGSYDDFLTSDDKEKTKISELRGLVAARLTQDWMKEDDFLLRFLREKDLDVPKAQEMILNTIRWREDNKIDNVLTEDFPEFEKIFHGYIEGCDKGGRPVLSASASDGDVSKEIEDGKENELKRFGMRLFEEATVMLRRMNAEGERVSQATIVVDLKGFNMASHACPRCIPVYLSMLDMFQANYPGYIHRIFAINAPKLALPLWDTYKSNASKKLRDTVKIFGENKGQWIKAIQGDISASEITSQFGGSKSKNLDLKVLHRSKKSFKCSLGLSEYER